MIPAIETGKTTKTNHLVANHLPANVVGQHGKPSASK